MKHLTLRGNNPSWAVTGRAGRNMSRYNKLMERENAVMLQLAEIPEEFKRKLSEAKDRIRHTEKEKSRNRFPRLITLLSLRQKIKNLLS